MTQFLMQHNIKKEKSEFNLLSNNLGSKKIINNNSKGSNNALRPDSLEIKIKPDNIVNIISKTEICSDNVNSWSGDHLDNFISQLKNANNTPSPITPNSFFNPSDVTQEQEQFADTLTLHLNKIKENYQSGCQPSGPSYLSNIIQISSANDERPLSIATVSVGNKVFLLNQINQTIDDNANQCLNYNLLDLPGNITIHGDVNNLNSNTIILQKNNAPSQLKVASIHNLCNQSNNPNNSPNIICSTPNVQFNSYQSHRNDGSELSHLMPIDSDVNLSQNDLNQQDLSQSMGFIKTSEGIIYTRIPDSSHTELLSQLNSLTNSVNRVNNNNSSANGQLTHVAIKAPNMEMPNQQSMNETRCLSPSSNGNESSYGANDSSVNNSHKDYSSNGTKINKRLDKDLDVDQQRRLERKRARNRDAARKCRDRKNNLILNLEQKYAKQTVEKELIRDKLLKSLEEIRRLTDYIAKHDPHSKFACFSNFLNEIKIHELTDTDLKDLNLI